MANDFQPFRLSDSINAAQGMALNQFRLSEASRGVQARDALSTAVSAGTPEAMTEYRSRFPEEAQAYDANATKASSAKIENAIKQIDFMGNVAAGVRDEATYQHGVAQLKNAGIDTSQFPSNYDPVWVKQQMEQTLSLKERLTLAAKDNKLVEIYDAKSPTGSRMVRESDAVGQPGKMPSGMHIEFDDQGRPRSITQGRGAGAGGMSKPTQTDVEKKLIEHSDTMSSLKAVERMYRPEFQKIGPRWGNLMTSIKDKAGADISADDRKQLESFSKYRAEASQLFSNTLKNLSGAAVTPMEFQRAQAWLPNPGTGLFDGDSPIELESKRQRFEDFTRRALIKYNYIRKNGLSKDDIDVDDMPVIVQKRGDELAQRLSKRYKGDELKRAVKTALSDEFGFGVIK